MKKNVLINLRVEQDLKERFQEIAESNGYTMSDLLTASMKEIVKRGYIPIYLSSKLPMVSNMKRILSIPEIRNAIIELITNKDYENDINSISLFGSYAKGKASISSDVDLVIDCQKLGLFDAVNLQNELKQALGKDVDLVVAGDLDPYFANIINNERIVLYEKQNLQ